MSASDEQEVRDLMAAIVRVRGRPVLLSEVAPKGSRASPKPSEAPDGASTPPEAPEALGVAPGALLERPAQVPATLAWVMVAAGALSAAVAAAALVLLIIGVRP